jgi:hypothetical protein
MAKIQITNLENEAVRVHVSDGEQTYYKELPAKHGDEFNVNEFMDIAVEESPFASEGDMSFEEPSEDTESDTLRSMEQNTAPLTTDSPTTDELTRVVDTDTDTVDGAGGSFGGAGAFASFDNDDDRIAAASYTNNESGNETGSVTDTSSGDSSPSSD